MNEPVMRREVRWRVWQQLPLLIALVVLWMLLWGSLTPLTIITGIAVAVVVTRTFYLPPVELSGRFNLFWFIVFLARFGFELLKASWLVALAAFSPRPLGQSSMIMVQLTTRSDFIMTLTAIAISLIPGSLVIEVDREGGRLYLHIMGASESAVLDRSRAEVLGMERLLVRALGSRDDLRSLR